MSNIKRMTRRMVWFNIRERLIDVAFMAWPIFSVVGIATGAFAFWSMVWGWVF